MRVSFLRPIDQFSGVDRLLDRLKGRLRNDAFSDLRFAVAFAKVGPLLRLRDLFRTWREKGKTAEGIFGIDLQGTSKQALEFALENFNKTYITHTTADATFHPKYYLFYGKELAVCIYGSYNLTVGGTETNLEGGVEVELDRAREEPSFQEAMSCWTSLIPGNCPITRTLDREVLQKLLRSGLLFDETVKRARRATDESAKARSEALSDLFPRISPKPPSPIPREVFSGPSRRRPRRGVLRRRKAPAGEVPTTHALAIQIVAHHNGEVFLSKNAVNENPRFFGYPFRGRTVPKKASNPSYPQRLPDPNVAISVFGSRLEPTVTKKNFALNMVYYEKKSEIRITFSPDLARRVAAFAVMVMRIGRGPYDYEIEVFNPDSPAYQQYLAVCNQTLPSGGARKARKYGWL